MKFSSQAQPEADTEMQRYLHPSAVFFTCKSYGQNTDVGPPPSDAYAWTSAHWDQLIGPVNNLVCLLGSGRPADCKSVH